MVKREQKFSSMSHTHTYLLLLLLLIYYSYAMIISHSRICIKYVRFIYMLAHKYNYLVPTILFKLCEFKHYKGMLFIRTNVCVLCLLVGCSHGVVRCCSCSYEATSMANVSLSYTIYVALHHCPLYTL